MSDLARTIAFAFRRKGVDAMPGGDLRLLLAYDLRWFAPEDAKRVVQRALDAGLVRDEGGALRPTFDFRATEIPLNFRPSLDVLEESAPSAPAPPPTQAQAQGSPELERAAEDERRRRGLMLDIEVARLIVRRRAGEDVTEEAARLEARFAAARSRA